MVAAGSPTRRGSRPVLLALGAAVAGVIGWLASDGAWAWTYPPYGPFAPYPPQQQGQYGQAPYPYPNQGQFQGWQFPPVRPDHSQGVPPSYQPAPPGRAPVQAPGYQPGWQNGYAQTTAQRPSAPPRLDWSLDETQPYVQQNLLLRLELMSADSLTEADLDLPGNGDALFQKLEGPDASYRTGSDGRREVVNKFVLILTPLRAGTLELPRIRVTGTRPGAYGGSERYEAVADRPIRLQVRPAMTSVRPWLPLRSLSLNASFDNTEEIKAGQPITLALELAAAGGHASQLPSLEDQLRSPDFRVYREQVLTDSRLSGDGRELLGKRTEYYTLVPQAGGRLHLPEIKVPWWNVELGTRQVASLPIHTLGVGGPGGSLGLGATGSGGGWGKVWLPFAALLLVLAGYWGGVLLRSRTPGEGPGLAERLRSGLRTTAGVASAQASAVATAAMRRLNPAPMATRLRATATGILPPSSHFLMAVRSANRAPDPAGWCARFEKAARGRLRVPSKTMLPNLTERILSLRPGADRAKLTRLMEQLDAALYGRQDIDFPRWKRDFMRQVGRRAGLFRFPLAAGRIRREHLPALNPSPAV